MTATLGRPLRPVLVVLAGFLGPLALFAALAEEVAVASWLGVGLLVAAAGALGASVFRRRSHDAVYWLVTLGGVAVFAPVLDGAFDRPPVTHGGGFTFPSGSAMAMAALVAGLAFLIGRVRRLVVGLGALAGVAAGATLVASSRYRASDVLAPGPADTVEVIYIAGPARAGSTLLDLLLSRLAGATSVGELQYVWTRGVRANDPCGCGYRFHECPFWRAVGRRAFGGWDEVDVDRVVDLQQRVGRLRHWPWLLGRRLRPEFQAEASELAGYAERLYLGIAAVSGRSVVIDSSKAPVPMLLLRRMRRIDGRVLHLVRDSRGVAYSWEKHVRRLPEGDEYMPTYAPARSALGWLALTTPPHLARLGGLRRRLVRYESVLERPRRELEGILAFAGVEASGDELERLERGAVDLGTNHIVSGNPLRFRRQPGPLAVDVEWRTAMRRRDRLVVSALTWPLQVAYGYAWPHRPLRAGRERRSLMARAKGAANGEVAREPR